jgi:hypothetical protein
MSTAIDQLRSHIQDHAVELATRAVQVTVADTQAHASRRSGDLAAGISATPPALNDTQVQSQITSAADYSKFQDEGTGIYGPNQARIFPKTAKVLRFDWPAAGGIVFAKSVAGAPGTHFFHDAMPTRWHEAIAESAGAG